MSKRVLMAAVVAAQFLCVSLAQAESVKFDISEFSVEGNTLLTAAEIQKVLTPFVGSNREMSDVNKAAEALHALYRNAGYSVVQVMPPVQTITAGKVLLKVVEDKIASIEVVGNKTYSADNIRASLPALKLDQSLNAYQLESAITLANENTAKQVSVNVKPGEKLGDIDTRIDVVEDKATKLMASADNTGSPATGLNKINLAYQNANLFDRDHALSLQYGGSASHPDKIYSLSGGYHIPLYGYGMSLDFIAAYSSSSMTNAGTFFAGKGHVLGARVNYPLSSIGHLRHKVIGGIDYKNSANTYTACNAGTNCGSTTDAPLSLAYFAQMSTPEFQGSSSVTYLVNIPGGQYGTAADYKNARPTALGSAVPTNWNAWRLTGSAGVPLPQDWQVRASMNAQYTRDLLIPGEQFGIGGASSIRGYPERIVAGDKGYSGNVEVYAPDFGTNPSVNSLRALVFMDAGRVMLNEAGTRNSYLYSAGFGLRMVVHKDLNFKMDMGWAQRPFQGAVQVNKGDVHGHFALNYVF